MTDINIIVMSTAIILALVAIYVLYSIMMYQGVKGDRGNELQLSTKNVLDQVEILFEKGEYALVQLLATKYLDRVPSHNAVRQYLAKAYYKDKKYNNSIKQCLMILKKSPNNIETRQLLGDCYIKKEMLGKAIKEYENIFEYRSTDTDIVRTLAELYRNTEQIFSSISMYNILVSLMEDNDEIAEVQSILAELNELAHDYPAAFEAYKTRLEIYPTDIPTNQKLIELYIKIQNYPTAIETLRYMLTFVTEPKILLWIYDKLISLYAETEEYEKAIESSNKLLEVQGSDKFKIKNDIAIFNIKLNNYETGISIFEELALLSQNAYNITLQLCDAYIQCKYYQKALDKYQALLDKALQKEAKEIRCLICDLYIKWAIDDAAQENYEESYKHLDLAIEYNAINSEIYYNKAINQMSQGNSAVAIELLQRALEFDKHGENHSKYYLQLSVAYHNLGQFFEEKKALNDLLKIDDKNPIGLYHSGLMYVEQHDTKTAEEYFKKTLQIDSTFIKAKYNLALLYESNNKDKAKELYLEILDQDPSFEEAKQALADLATSDY